ncbi:hypothetical protein [Sphingomonas mesophila]|uniref:hypothetical protein n=1 Tax=Sphingomonas mesophila TaxID=2303576 RepID=UPI0013C353B6|nr:hypothetical protein [Sphingomonas mesophila]
MKIPSPRDGWRVFAGEVGVIVLGVLLALGAQQVVQTIQTRDDVRVFRATIDGEIAKNLWIYEYRDRQTACTDRRVARLTEWLGSYREGAQARLIDARFPVMFSVYRSAWDNKDGQVFAEVPAAARSKYAEFYDELENNARNAQLERAAWDALLPYELAGTLDLADRRTLHAQASAARRLNRNMKNNISLSRMIGRQLGISPAMPDGFTGEELAALSQCVRVAAIVDRDASSG